MNIMKVFFKNQLLFAYGGLLYYTIEILWRGYSHWSMFCLGGICFLYAGIQNEFTEWEESLLLQIIRVDIFVLVCEFITGIIVNLWLQWDIWDYSDLPFNILGQSCPQFAILFLPLCFIAIILDDYIRYWVFDEEKPHYKIF